MTIRLFSFDRLKKYELVRKSFRNMYSIDNEEVVILEDNTHAPVEDYIENFIEGAEYTGAEAYVDKAFVVMSSKEDPYSVEDVEAHFKNGNYGEVM